MESKKGSDKSAFWKNLDDDIDRIGQRVKQNLQKYDRTKFSYDHSKTTSNSQRKVSPMSKTLTSISQCPPSQKELQRLRKKEQEKTTMMNNRISYLRNDRSRQYKTIELAKKKFEHIVEVRNQTIREKNSMRQRRQSFMNEEKECKLEKVKEVKSARGVRDHSVSNWRKEVESEANRIRRESIQNERMIRDRKVVFKLENREKANRTREDLERSRSIVSEMSEKKIKFAKERKIKELSTQLRTVKSQKKSNEQLFLKLKSESERISKWRTKAQRQITDYRSLLGLETPKVKQQAASQRTSQSFYLTNI